MIRTTDRAREDEIRGGAYLRRGRTRKGLGGSSITRGTGKEGDAGIRTAKAELAAGEGRVLHP